MFTSLRGSFAVHTVLTASGWHGSSRGQEHHLVLIFHKGILVTCSWGTQYVGGWGQRPYSNNYLEINCASITLSLNKPQKLHLQKNKKNKALTNKTHFLERF